MLAACSTKISPYFKKCANNLSSIDEKVGIKQSYANYSGLSIDDAQRHIAQNFRYTQDHPLTETEKYNNFVRGTKDVCSEDNVTEIKELIIEN